MGLRRPLLLASAALATLLAGTAGAAAGAAGAAGRPAAAAPAAARSSSSTTSTTSTSTSTTSPATTTTSTSTTTTTSTTLPGQGQIVLENGGTVTVAVPTLPSSLDPLVPAGSNRVTAMVTAQLWPSAFTTTANLSPKLDSDVVTSAYLTAVSPQTVVYTIAPKASWSDGVPITAADFVYDWHEQLAEGSSLPASDPIAGYQDISSVTGSGGGKTVTVVFAKPYSDWEALFSPLVPAHVAARKGAAAFTLARATSLPSGGPYEVTKVVAGKEVVLSKNPRWSGTPGRLDHIDFVVAAGDRAVLAALRAGTVDVGLVSPSTAAARTVAASGGKLTSGTKPGPLLWQLAFNLARPTLAVPSVREAIAKAIDRHELLADTYGLVSPASPISGNRLYVSGSPGSQGNGGGFAHADDTTADHLLERAGYTVDPATGLVLTPAGAPLTLTVTGPLGNPTVLAVEALLQSQLLQAGITLEVRNVPESTLLANVLPSGGYELALAPYQMTPYLSETAQLYTDPVGPTPLDVTQASSASPSTTLPGSVSGGQRPTDLEPGAVTAGAVSRDVLGFDDPAVTGLYAQAAAELAPPAQADLYNEIDQTLWRDLPTIPLFEAPVTVVNRADILNVEGGATWAGPLWNAENWVIELSPGPMASTTTTTAAPTTTTAPRSG